MARYSKTKPRKSLKTLQDKEFYRLASKGEPGKWPEFGNKNAQKRWKKAKRGWWKRRLDPVFDTMWGKKKKNKSRPVKAIEGRKSGRAGEGPVKAIEGRKAKRPHEEMPESRKRSKAARLYGDWLKD